jgi:plasmid maintenance system antidote protein VapI
MATKRLRPVHPGDILLHEFMQPLKLSSYKLAKELGVTAPRSMKSCAGADRFRRRWPCDCLGTSALPHSFG